MQINDLLFVPYIWKLKKCVLISCRWDYLYYPSATNYYKMKYQTATLISCFLRLFKFSFTFGFSIFAFLRALKNLRVLSET